MQSLLMVTLCDATLTFTCTYYLSTLLLGSILDFQRTAVDSLWPIIRNNQKTRIFYL